VAVRSGDGGVERSFRLCQLLTKALVDSALSRSLSRLQETIIHLHLDIGGGGPLTWTPPESVRHGTQPGASGIADSRRLPEASSESRAGWIVAHMNTDCKACKGRHIAHTCSRSKGRASTDGKGRGKAAAAASRVSAGCASSKVSKREQESTRGWGRAASTHSDEKALRQAECPASCLAGRAAAGAEQQSRSNVCALLRAFHADTRAASLTASDLRGERTGSVGGAGLDRPAAHLGPQSPDVERRAPQVGANAKSRVHPTHAVALASLKGGSSIPAAAAGAGRASSHGIAWGSSEKIAIALAHTRQQNAARGRSGFAVSPARGGGGGGGGEKKRCFGGPAACMPCKKAKVGYRLARVASRELRGCAL